VTTYNGSLHDVTTLIRTVKHCSILNNHLTKLVLDRSFYSRKNINYLLSSEYTNDFIIGLPTTTSLCHNTLNKHYFINNDINYVIQLNGQTLFAVTKKIKWEGNKYLNAHIYIDHSKNNKKRDQITEDILMMFNNVCTNHLDHIDDPDYRYVLNFRKSFKQPTTYIIKRNNDIYNQLLNHQGWFVILTNCDKDPKKVLRIYRNRDIIERGFNILKNFLNNKITNAYNNESYDSKIFIAFITMILFSMIDKVMKANNLYNNKNIDELFEELSNQKAIIINNQYIIDPLTKHLKNYYDYFKCDYPK
jgi:transposase